jgi:hypothetical protein|tara:strand:+ start:590 stop:859 length:270 start_codon:yes stop_codon:yes gene_type:complete
MVEKTEVEITRESIKLLSELVELYKKNKGDDYSVSSMEEVIMKEEELKKIMKPNDVKPQSRLTNLLISNYLSLEQENSNGSVNGKEQNE